MASNFKNAGGTVGQTDDATANIYTCPASTSAVLHAIYLSNTSVTNVGRVDIKVTIDGGSTFYHIGKYKEAREQVLALLKQNDNARLYLLLAMIYESLGKKKPAKQLFVTIRNLLGEARIIFNPSSSGE